jgi:hypothetical protein
MLWWQNTMIARHTETQLLGRHHLGPAAWL